MAEVVGCEISLYMEENCFETPAIESMSKITTLFEYSFI
jgi:hypothetical protein